MVIRTLFRTVQQFGNLANYSLVHQNEFICHNSDAFLGTRFPSNTTERLSCSKPKIVLVVDVKGYDLDG